MDNVNLNALRDKAYKNACDHGFHDRKLSNEHLLMLVITELSEAVEADRRWNYCRNNISSTERYSLFPTEESKFRIEFRSFIKDTVEDEIADAVIRLLDIAGLRGIDLPDIDLDSDSIEDMSESCSGETFTESIYDISVIPEREKGLYDFGSILLSMIKSIFGLAKHMGIDLIWHIEQKMKYNALRERMHGKKF